MRRLRETEKIGKLSLIGSHVLRTVHPLYKCLLIGAALACFALGSTFADDAPTQNYVELPAADPAFKWIFWYRSSGAPCPICKSVAVLAVTQRSEKPSYCVLFKAAVASPEFQEPIWKSVPLDLNLARRTIALWNIGQDPTLRKDLNLARGLSDDARTAAFWEKYGRFIDPLIASSAVTLETTQVDIDNDGDADTLYRLRQVRRPDVGSRQFDSWTVGKCSEDHPDPVFNLLALEKDSATLAKFLRSDSYLQDAQIVRYRDHTYLWHVRFDGGAIEDVRQSSLGSLLRQVFYGKYGPAPKE
jgi:hypothetical protein